HVSRWANRLRYVLRPVDRVGLYGPAAVLVSIPEATLDGVRQVASTLNGGDPPLVCRAVMFPGDGGSGEELIAALQVATRAGSTPPPPTDSHDIIVKNPAMKEVMATVKRLASSTIAVLINGETGTGKEVIARAIHEMGPRKKKPLRSINCAAIPQTLI